MGIDNIVLDKVKKNAFWKNKASIVLLGLFLLLSHAVTGRFKTTLNAEKVSSSTIIVH